jgi:hypothetical protein
MKDFVILLMISWTTSMSAQDSNVWGTLAMVQSTSEYNSDYGYEVQKVSVSAVVQALENKEIAVEGYIVPLSGKIEQSHFMLSSLPVNMCFFCGKAGPETAMQVFMKQSKKIAYTENKIKVKGRLIVNPNSQNEILYTLEDAILINENP